MAPVTHWLDRVTAPVAPRWTLKRQRARVAADLLVRHYEAASASRRTSGWRRSTSDANAAIGPGLARLREVARDLVRNNGYAEAALSIIVDQAVGYGIVAKPKSRSAKVQSVWNDWANSTDCDADGRHDFAGLQKLVLRTVAESGECLVRRRIRRPEDGLKIPLQLQVLEPDFLDTTKDVEALPNLGQIIQGVEFDAIGRRAAYWLFRNHPGALMAGFGQSVRVPAEGVLHVFRALRPGQVRGPSWFAPVLLTFKDLDHYEDATLLKQDIAACLAVITTDLDGSAPPLGTATDTTTPGIDSLEPGMIMNVPAGRDVKVVEPPSVRDYADYVKTQHHKIATGLGITHEDLTGVFSDVNYSSARMSRLKRWARVEDDRWRLLIPQFCDPVWGWVMQAAQIMNLVPAGDIAAEWTTPPMPMIEPDKEGLAYQRNIRSGIMTLSEAIRERGYDPAQLLDEMAADNATLDRLKLVLDSDPRKMTQAGQQQQWNDKTQPNPSANGNGNGTGRHLGDLGAVNRLFSGWVARQDEDRVVDIFERLFGERHQ